MLSGGLYKEQVQKGDILRMGKVAVLMGRRKFVAFGMRGVVRVMPWISVGSFENFWEFFYGSGFLFQAKFSCMLLEVGAFVFLELHS